MDGQGRIFIRWPDNYQMGLLARVLACRVRLEKRGAVYLIPLKPPLSKGSGQHNINLGK
jgi:hypothetical protein